MSGWERLIIKVYDVLLAFYPPEYRAEFGEEMGEVFTAALTDGQQPGRLVWQEVRDWPKSVLQEHLRARRRKMPSNGYIEGKPLPRRELLAAMIIFLIPIFSIISSIGTALPQWMDYFMLILFWAALLFAFGLAVIKGLPLWSLPYLGLFSMLAIVLSRYDRFWGWIYPIFIQTFGSRYSWSIPIRIIYVGIFSFIMLFAVLLIALILVNLLRLLPNTRGVWDRMRADWTQFSFMLYGGLVFYILLAFDEYRHRELWQFIALLCLALGAWLYLRTKGQKQRILIILGGASGALWTIALAKWVLIPLQKWPTGYPVAPSEVTRWVESGSTLLIWILILAMLLAPAILKLMQPPPITMASEVSISAK